MVTKKHAFGKALLISSLYLPFFSACRTFSNTDATSSRVSMKVPSAFACSTALLLSSIQHKINSPNPAKVIVNPIADVATQEAEFIKELKTLNAHKSVKFGQIDMENAAKNALCDGRKFDSNSALSDLELISTFLYTAWAYRPINQELKENKCSQFGLITGILVDGVMRLPMKAADPAFYRVEAITGDLLDSLKETIGETYSPPSFFSTTTKMSAVTGFVRQDEVSKKFVFWNIKKAKGPHLENASAYPREGEVLFPPGSRFKVEKIEATDSHKEFGLTQYPLAEVTKVDLTPLDAAFRISGDEQ